MSFRHTAAPARLVIRPLTASLLVLLAGASVGAAANPEPVARREAVDTADPVATVQTAGRLDSVTVYRGQALVTRVVDLDGAPGLREIVVTDLPERIIAASLYAEALGEAGVEVRSVRFRARPVSQDVREEVRKIDEQVRAVQDKIKAADAAAGLIAQHTAYLGKLQEFVAPTAQTELKSGVLNAETIERLSQFQYAERQKLLDRSLALEIEKRTLAEQMELLQRERATLAGSSSRTVREAVVFVSVSDRGVGVPVANGAKAVGIALRYLVDHANWSPSYNVRAAIDAKKIGVDYYASIEQMTGEDWSGVSMTLSTATPTLAAKAPALEPMTIHLASLGENAQAQPQLAGTFKDYAEAKNEFGNKRQALDAQRRQSQVAHDGAAAPADADSASVDKAINRVASEEQLFDLAANINVDRAASKKLVEERPGEGVTVTYSLPSRTSLPSRADRQLIQVASVEMAGQFYKLATPVLSEYVYNEASITNTSDLVLLEGPVATYVAGQFVGRGRLPTVAAGESFTMGLGIDPSLRASRRLAQRTETLQGGNRVIESAYELALENFGNAAASVRLIDRLPTIPAAGGSAAEIKVTLLPPSAQAGHATSDDAQYLAGPAKQGILRWDLDVPAKAVDVRAAKLEYRFQLEFDKQRTIAAGSGVGGMAAK